MFVIGESYAAIEVTAPGIFAVAYLAILVNVTGYLLFFGLLRRVGAFQVSLVNYLQPIAAAVIAWAILGEELATATVIGFIVIVIGFTLVKREQLFEYITRSRVSG
jgi:drug/metabolite transporter (DMT)-like permease